MAELLNAPCVFCGYNGERYWQSGTHEKSCPWHDVSTPTDRLWRVREEITRLRAQLAEAEGQEAVAVVTESGFTTTLANMRLPVGTKLYTHPAPAKVPDKAAFEDFWNSEERRHYFDWDEEAEWAKDLAEASWDAAMLEARGGE